MGLNKRGLLIVLSGPSGVGKGTIRKAMFEKENHNFSYSISMTTRKPREGEEDGKDYYFVTKEEFLKRIDEGKFLEHAQFVGNYYGTPLDKVNEQLDLGKEVILEIDVAGAMQVKKLVPECVLIFILPPSKESLYERLKGRGTETEEVIRQRIETANKELLIAKNYDYAVINDKVDKAVDEIIEIIDSEHLRVDRFINDYLKSINLE